MEGRVFLGVLLGYWGTGLWLLPLYQFQINPDATAYLTLGAKYLEGNWKDAVNGCWGPMISWLLVPFLAIKLPGIVALKLEMLSVGTGVIAAARVFFKRLGLNEVTTAILLVGLIPIVLYCALIVTTTDLLVSFFLLMYVNVIIGREFTKSTCASAGLIGAGMYLSKPYGLPFFLVHFSSILVWQWVRSSVDRRRWIVCWATGVGAFLCASGVWIAAVSLKYDRLAYSTSQIVNFSIEGPFEHRYSYEYLGLMPPPNPTAMSCAEDPSAYPIREWNPLGSLSDLRHESRLIYSNLKILVFNALLKFSVLSPLILLGALVGAGRKDLFGQGPELLVAATCVMFCGGIILIHTEVRYFWPCWAILMGLGAKLLTRLGAMNDWSQARSLVAATILTGSFLPTPVTHFVSAVSRTDPDLEVARQLKELSEILSVDFGVRGNLASTDQWHYSLYIASFMNAKYFGLPKAGSSVSELQTELRTHRIDYLFVWRDERGLYLYLKDFPEITGGRIDGLRVYRISSAPR